MAIRRIIRRNGEGDMWGRGGLKGERKKSRDGEISAGEQEQLADIKGRTG